MKYINRPALYNNLKTFFTLSSQPRVSFSMSASYQANKKHSKFGDLALATSGPLACALKGPALLNTPFYNKGAAFPADERAEFKLTGLLPTNISSLDVQTKRAYAQYSSRDSSLAKNTFMTSLAEQNQVLYFRVSLTYLFRLASCYLLLASGSLLYSPRELYKISTAHEDWSRGNRHLFLLFLARLQQR